MTMIAMLLAALLLAPAADVSGTWNMGLEGDHVIPTALVLKQDGTAVTGTIAMPTQRIGARVEVTLTGELHDGALKLSGTVAEAKTPTTIAITGTLKDDGSLEGTLVMRSNEAEHEVPWTAERLKERK